MFSSSIFPHPNTFFIVFQGNNVRKVQLNERWEPGDRLRSDSHAAAGAERLDDPEWHEAAKTCGAAYDRAWRRLILGTNVYFQRGNLSHLHSGEDSKFAIRLNLKDFLLTWQFPSKLVNCWLCIVDASSTAPSVVFL